MNSLLEKMKTFDTEDTYHTLVLFSDGSGSCHNIKRINEYPHKGLQGVRQFSFFDTMNMYYQYKLQGPLEKYYQILDELKNAEERNHMKAISIVLMGNGAGWLKVTNLGLVTAFQSIDNLIESLKVFDINLFR